MNLSFTRKNLMLAPFLAALLFIADPHGAYAHCDTMDGPVIMDAHKAIEEKDVTAVLKWVKPEAEEAVRSAFRQVLAEDSDRTRQEFFATLVKIHRAGEGASFTGVKPAGEIEPAIAAADRALAHGSPQELIDMMSEDMAAAIRNRYARAASLYQHKDDSVAQGREFVEAYVAYTHFIEELHRMAQGARAGHEAHAGRQAEAKHSH